jgi:pilus assembly protein CpaE
MVADGITPGAPRGTPEGWTPGQDRALVMAYVTDASVENVLRDALSDATPEPIEINRGGIRAAITALSKVATPRSLIVDVSGEDEPLNALSALSQVVEPDVQLLVIGEIQDVDFYREITRGMGAREYLAKPLTRDMITRLFAPIVMGRPMASQELSGGRVITITGARGGVGATTVAANLSWHFGVQRNRHTVLLDPNLHTGTAALFIDANTGPGLRAALEMPDRIDDLFVERASQILKDRLHIMAGQEALAERPICAVDAGSRLVAALRRRYNFIVADVPFQPVPLYRDLLDLADQRVIVFEPTLSNIRDTLRLRALNGGAQMTSNAILVLNRDGMPAGLTRKQVEDALETRVDVVIPDTPRKIVVAANMGEPMAGERGFYRLRMHELARLVSFNRLLDSSTSVASGGKRREDKTWRFPRVWGKR